MQDLKEIVQNPLETVNAQPVSDKNLFLWHANIFGLPGTLYEGTCFHLTLEVPADYPLSAPTVKMSTMIQHPHVFGNWICLDLLETHDEVVFLSFFIASCVLGVFVAYFLKQTKNSSNRKRPTRDGRVPTV
jgi:ubiquitin-protein ligase